MVTRPPRQVPPPERRDGEERRSSYARFIPREEIQAFSAWSPDALQGGNPPARAPISAPAPPKPPEAQPRPPEPSVPELVHAARQSGYQDGYRDGMSALDAFKQSFATQMTAQLGALVQSFDTEFRALEDQMADSLARTAVELARQVVRSEITQRPEHIARVAHDAVEALLLSARHVRVRVNPSDLPLVQQGAGDEMRAREAQIVPDPSVERGGCRVDSDISSVNASIALRWQQAVGALGQAAPWDGAMSPSLDAGAEPDAVDDDEDIQP